MKDDDEIKRVGEQLAHAFNWLPSDELVAAYQRDLRVFVDRFTTPPTTGEPT